MSADSEPELVKKCVVEVARHQLLQFFRQVKGRGMTKLERWREIEGLYLLSDRFGYLRMAVAQSRGPQAGVAIENPPASIIRKPHILRRHDNARITLELPVAGIGHPVGFKGQLDQT